MKLREKLNELKAAQQEYHEKADSLTPEQMVEERTKFKGMRQVISETISEGAQECPDCGNKPAGIFHDGTPNAFEVGCLVCRDHRVRQALPEDAVEQWNAGNYLPPREEGTVVATHRDATGKTIDERILKPQS